MRLENKVAIVTGSSRGIGYAVACGFAKEGAKVVICGTTIEGANKGLENLKLEIPNVDAMAVALNVSELASVEHAFKEVYDKYGHIDVLVNNAGIVFTKMLENMTDEEYNKVMDTNAGGTIRCSREALKYMKNGGSIINTTSMNGIYGTPSQVAYSASKAAVIGITKSLAKELGRYHIRVNAVAPGMIGTDMVKENVTEEIKMRLMAMTPLNRMGEPSDLQGIYTLLASDESSFITGTIISVDGGLVM